MNENRVAEDYQRKSLPTEEEHEKRANEECSTFFRVLRVEYPKFFCLATLGFIISFIYSTLRDAKDTLIIGKMLPTSISYLKTTAVLFFTIAFGIMFQYLMSKGVKMRSIMLGAQIGFGIYFVIYSLVIFPIAETIEPYKFLVSDLFSDGKMFVRGLQFLEGMLYLVNFWTCSFFYVSAEMWGSFVLSLLFFGCVNEICLLKQALRFYPLFLICANIALMLSGLMGLTVSYFAKSNKDIIINFYRYFLLLLGFLCAVNYFVYKYLMDKVIPYPVYIATNPVSAKKTKTKVGMIAGIVAAFSNQIILALSLSVLAYGMVTNITEGAGNMTITGYAEAMNQPKESITMKTKASQQVIVGLMTGIVLMSPMKSFIQRKGWLSLGLVSPVLSLIGSTIFFGCIWVNSKMVSNDTSVFTTIGKSIGSTINWTLTKGKTIELVISMIVIMVIKIMKYAAFDICKEAVGVKIPKEHRSRFKGIYDGVFGKLGKSVASIMQIVLLYIFNTNDIRKSVNVTLTATFLISSVWLYATIYLGVNYNKAVREGKDLPIKINEVEDNNEKA
ncbi:ATP:ADP antiporter, AAA family [Nematocida minor]|uniref:ATP:ADP antiporter, AAA family n=1 Tax=Nematocida minor TaxID=1912983 RepID=UPI00221FC61F|nr:ATP:ADP antiporter, AAA family [Nematocida minor]KAI5190854.1 ATP:ADP antiporter, AAA family [Nematocida minor]